MSALEHIRKRPALVISILGLALVLFIITAVSDNIFSFFGDRDTAVKVDGEKLKYDKLHRASSMISDQMRQSGRDDLDASYAEEMALQQIVSEELFNNQLEALGIEVTDEEMEGYLFGPASIATAEAQRYGFPTAEDFYSYAYSNEAGAENARALWQDMENRIRRQIMDAKYRLQLGAITANKLDAKAYYDENRNVTLNVAKVDYVTLGNEDYKVSDEEIKDRYNKEKERYALDTEVRLVDYILVTPTPSPEDASAASEEVAAAISNLKTTPGTEAIAGNYSFETKIENGSEASLPAYLRNALERIEADSVVMLSFNGSAYNIAKLLSKETAVEKADVDFFITMNETLPIDSITAAVAAGDIAQYGDSVQKVSKNNLRLINGELLADYADKFINAPEGANVVTDKEFKTQILNELFNGQIDPSMDMDAIGVCYKVNSVDAPATIYEIAAITRSLVPSEATISGLRQQLADYSAKNATADSFKNNIANSNFHIEQGRVSPDRFAVIGRNGQRIPQTASLARWAMEDAKKGDVSDVTDAGESFVVVAVSDIYADKYVPVTDPTVKEQITAELRAEKKGAKLVNDYKGKGKNVDEYAAAMNTQPITVRANYAQNDGGILRADSKFLAAVGAAQKGQLVGPVATDNAAVVFEVVEVDNAGGEFNFEQVAPMAARMFQFNLDQALRANKDIEYKALRFQARD